MCGAKQVQDYLDRVESLHRNFHEKGIPAAHGAIPEAGQFERTQFPALEALGGDKSGVGVHEIRQIEFPALIVFQAAYKIHRIEVGGGYLLDVGWVECHS